MSRVKLFYLADWVVDEETHKLRQVRTAKYFDSVQHAQDHVRQLRRKGWEVLSVHLLQPKEIKLDELMEMEEQS